MNPLYKLKEHLSCINFMNNKKITIFVSRDIIEKSKSL